jgi:hypothetical protein
MPLQKGQLYRISSFDAGFININPVDLVLVVEEVDYDKHLLRLSPTNLAEIGHLRSCKSICNWFREVYPDLKKRLVLNVPEAFDMLINQKIAVPEHSPTIA